MMALAFSTWAKKRLSPTFFFFIRGTTRGSAKPAIPSLSRKYFYMQTNSIPALSGVGVKWSQLIALIGVHRSDTLLLTFLPWPAPWRTAILYTIWQKNKTKKQTIPLIGRPLNVATPTSYICTTSDTHKALTAHLLCGTQQGSHVLDWEGATRLHPSAGAQAPYMIVTHARIHVHLRGLVAHGDITLLKTYKCSVSLRPRTLWCDHLWLT